MLKIYDIKKIKHPYLAYDYIIRASIVVQFLVPFFHHSTFAVIISL
jgi:hypothetical protein